MKERTTQGAPVRSPSRPSALLVALLFVGAAGLFCWSKWQYLGKGWMEDLPVYTHAVSDWMSGRNPYNASLAPLYFLYPPAFLYLAAIPAYLLPAHWGPVLYVLVNTCALLALPMVLSRFYFRQQWLSPAFALLLFLASPRFTGVLAYQTMNIASILYCTAFLAAIPGLRRGRWRWFYLAVFLAAMIKVTFLSLLLLPLLAGRRQWWKSIGCGVAVVAANLLELLLTPTLYHGFEQSLENGVLDSHAFGYGVFGILHAHEFDWLGSPLAPYAFSCLFSVLLCASLFVLRMQLEKTGWTASDLAGNGHWLALVVTAVVLVNPRLMQYDMDIALLAGFVLWIFGLRTPRVLLWMAILFLPSLAIPLVIENPRLHGAYTTILAVAAFCLGCWRLRREAGVEQPGAQRIVDVQTAAASKLDAAIR